MTLFTHDYKEQLTWRDAATGRHNLAYIPPEFNVPHTAEFDPPYTKKLFEFGYRLAEAGYPWAKRPPILVSGEEDAANRASQLDR